jgi:hypothetical protein
MPCRTDPLNHPYSCNSNRAIWKATHLGCQRIPNLRLIVIPLNSFFFHMTAAIMLLQRVLDAMIAHCITGISSACLVADRI